MNWLDFIIGMIVGSNLVWLFFQFKRAPLLEDWHQIGRTFQRTYHFKDHKFREGEISEN
jgi:hypothetical protein